MSSTTSAAVLTYVGADERTNTISYSAPSQSQPGRVNTISVDVTDGAWLCDCRAAEFGRECWHVAAVALAWLAHPAMVEVRALDDVALLGYGRKAARMVRVARQRHWTPVPSDVAALLAARCEWRRRAAARAAAYEAAQTETGLVAA